MAISSLRRIGAAAAVVGGVALGSGPAMAQTCYPPTEGCAPTSSTTPVTGPTLALSDATVVAGQTITATVSGFQPQSSPIITIASVERQIGSLTVSASGSGSTSVTIPNDMSLGAHTVYARGTGSDGKTASASQGVTVVAAGQGAGKGTGRGGSLARTGAVAVPTALIGFGLVAGGVALKRSSKRGKASSAV